jgi:hypothetical protein
MYDAVFLGDGFYPSAGQKITPAFPFRAKHGSVDGVSVRQELGLFGEVHGAAVYDGFGAPGIYAEHRTGHGRGYVLRPQDPISAC